MTPEKKRKLRNIALLALLGLIGGTFAFQSFNQQAINDREGQNNEGAAGRIHDYYNRETENKDVFVENYGDEPLLVRIQLKEFLSKNGESIVIDAERENLESWTVWQPSARDIHRRNEDSPSHAFESYTDWTFGFSGEGVHEMSARNMAISGGAPYMPTFNHDRGEERTAAAGDALDYVEGGATHPGDGTEGYWRQHATFKNYDPEEAEEDRSPLFPGRAVEQDVQHTLLQERPPITMAVWEGLDEHEKIGRYWVVDEETGWAYWASYLQHGQATSYLIDQADMADAIKATPGSWFYAILVQGNMVSPTEDNINTFFEQGGDTARARDLVNRMGETNIPNFNGDIQPDESFFVEGVEYGYIGPHGGGHLVVPMQSIGRSNFGETTDYMSSNVRQTANAYYNSLPAQLQRRVLPVSYGSGRGIDEEELEHQLNSGDALDIEDYITRVDERGERTAFILSIVDILFYDGKRHRNTAEPPSLPDFWTRTTAGKDFGITQVYGWSVISDAPQWRKWEINEIRDVLPALMLSQIGEMQK